MTIVIFWPALPIGIGLHRGVYLSLFPKMKTSNQTPKPSEWQGLSAAEAKLRWLRDGANELAGSKPKSVFRIAFSVLIEPMFILLVSCGILYLILGDVEGGIVLLFFVMVVMGITIYQERKTERALDALKSLASPRALVIRDGIELRIPGREVVLGDTMVLREGDRIPADAKILTSLNLMVDESLLTGESMPVRKDESSSDGALTTLYSSTLVVQGMCVAETTRIGQLTRIGEIGKSLEGEEGEKTLLQLELGRLVKRISIAAIITCIVVVIAFYFVRGGFLNALLAGLSLAMAMLPEEFPVIFTIFTALGAWRISKRNVLTTKPSSIETLGAATVLCSDKTGTLTMNKMQVQSLYANSERFDLVEDPAQEIPENQHILVEYGILASQTDPFDPMEKAIKRLGEVKLQGTEHLHQDWELIKEFPLSKELLAMSRAFRQPGSDARVIAAKGAPEAIFDLCHLDAAQIAQLTTEIKVMASRGLRVIAVARGVLQDQELPSLQHDFDFAFCGLIGLADPVRPEAAKAVAECKAAGIKVIMITGDYPETAVSIGKEIGLDAPFEVLTGQELEALSEHDLAERLKTVRIFARVAPEQKLKLVRALKENGEVVAMTGDGVNDAPALKSAHIGIAMGQKGTDVAREAASLVLLDDNFASIVAAIRLGRRIFDNIRKAFAYVVSIHLPIAGLALVPVMIGSLPLLLWPVHIAFLELIIDPASSVAFESVVEEDDIMQRKPRKRDEPMFGGRLFLHSLFNGLVLLGLLLLVCFVSIRAGMTDDATRTLTFLSLVSANAALILSGLSSHQHIFQILKLINKATVYLLLGVAVCIALILFIPLMREMFKMSLFPAVFALLPLGSFVLQLIWMELLKRFG
jgi:P-type Ca2+ transporter type 2C